MDTKSAWGLYCVYWMLLCWPTHEPPQSTFVWPSWTRLWSPTVRTLMWATLHALHACAIYQLFNCRHHWLNRVVLAYVQYMEHVLPKLGRWHNVVITMVTHFQWLVTMLCTINLICLFSSSSGGDSCSGKSRMVLRTCLVGIENFLYCCFAGLKIQADSQVGLSHNTSSWWV